MSNPIDEFLEMKKEAGFWDAAKRVASSSFGKKFQEGAGLAAGSALVGGGALAVHKIRNSISRKNDFKRMMKTDPELRGLQGEKPQFFNQAYNSLRRMNPTFGKDPLVAGSYMRKMMSNPDAAGLTLAQTVKEPDAPGTFRAELGPFKFGM